MGVQVVFKCAYQSRVAEMTCIRCESHKERNIEKEMNDRWKRVKEPEEQLTIR